MFELHITPNPDFLDAFEDIAQRLKLKLIKHWNLDINGNPLYLETMIAEKCKDLHELNYKIELMIRTAKQHNLLRIKVESIIKEDFSVNVPYRLGTTYYEVHIDIDVNKIDKNINYICYKNELAISKNPLKDSYMLTYRNPKISEYKEKISSIIKDLKDYNISYSTILKEYCFLDDNIGVDSPWLDTYEY